MGKLSKSSGPQGVVPIWQSTTPCAHFGIGETVKRAHAVPEKIVGLFVYDDGTTLLTLRAVDGSVCHVIPVALNHHND
jgi:hypothetical protein